jgi:hypothetical protein
MVTLLLIAGSPALAAPPARIEARVYFQSDVELLLKLGDRLGELDICTVGRTETGLDFLLIDTDADELAAVNACGLVTEVTYADIRDKFREVTGCNPDDGSFRDFGYFFNYWEMRDTLTHIAANHPLIARVDTSLRSYLNKAFWCIKVSDNVGVTENEPQVFINAATHAREPLGTHACISFAARLCAGYGTDSLITWLVNNREIYIVPVMNPDGYIYNSDSGGASSNWRKNRNATSPRSGPGVDLNRNYGYKWGYDNNGSSPTPSQETYRGPSRFSEPETQVIRDFQAAHKFRTCMDFHTYGQYNMYPWGYANTQPPERTLLQECVDTFRVNNSYPANQTGQVYSTIYPCNGLSVDWEYADTLLNGNRKLITYAFTCELGTTDFWYGSSNPTYVDNEVNKNIPNLYYLTRVAGVYLNPVSMVVNDSVGGNRTGQLDPGETANLWFTVKNRAIHPLDTAKSVTAVLLSADTMVQVITPSASFPAVPRRTTANNGASQIQVHCSPNASPGTNVNLRLEVTYTDDGITMMQPLTYRLTIGSNPSAVSEERPEPALRLTVSNPVRGLAGFQWTLARGQPATLSIVARDGRLVRSLRASDQVVWDGCDNLGRPAPNGVYFARLVAGTSSTQTSLVVAR